MRPWMSDVFNRVYAPDPTTRQDRLASPAWITNLDSLAGIAPALIITCELDRLRNEGVSYAHALDAVGALVEHHDVPGNDHGYNILDFGTRTQTEHIYDRIVDHVRHATSK
ncbi:alpha/beta hydrolase [Streptomyces sp. HNM0575]|nr:alpha/beta hydrolase [Streptomyces sp. HNM0575]